MQDLTLSHYRIVRELGRGGMGVVYEAVDTKLDRPVAIKVLPDAALASQTDRERFFQEARAAAALSHPNIATIHQIDDAVPTGPDGAPPDGFSGSCTFIAMEYVEGQTLESRMQQERLAVDEAVEIVIALAQALEEAHEKGIVHRDIKPANVMLSARGRVKILDFGVAKLSQSSGLTKTGATVGTLAYMSPEQARGEAVDNRTDIWALGVVFYEMLAGRRPFGGAYEAAVLYAIINEAPESLDAAGVSGELAGIIGRMLEKHRDDRYDSMSDVVAALALARSASSVGSNDAEDADDSGGTSAKQDNSPKERRGTSILPSFHRPGAAFVTAVIALIVLVVVGYFAFQSAEKSAYDSIAVLPLENISGDADAQPFVYGIHEGLLTELSRLSNLNVISRTSVLQYAGIAASIPEIADELGVSAILEGSVQQVDDRVSVSVKLIDGARDRQLWADSYNRQLTTENIFELQEELARTIAGQLQARLAPDARPDPERAPTGDLEAYRLNAQGRAQMNERTESGMRTAVQFFERAVARDSTYSMAWVGLSDALRLLHDYGFESGEDVLERAEAAANRALELAPGLAEAHASRGMVYEARHDLPAALRELERALEIRPGYPEVHHWMSWVERLIGTPDEALQSARRAVELNPLSLEAISNLSFSYMETGAFDSGLREAQRIVELQPDWTTGHLIAGMATFYTGDYRAARSHLRNLSVPWAGSGPVGMLALVEIAAGDTVAAMESVAHLDEEEDAFNRGIVRAAWGDIDGAFVEFGRVQNWNDYWPTFVLRYHFKDLLAPLRSDSRFDEYLSRVDESWGIVRR